MTTTFTPIIPSADRLGQVQEYYFSRKLREIAQLRAAGKDIINLGIGSPDLAPAPEVIQTLQEAAAASNNHAYQGYTGIPELRQAFAQWYDRFFAVTLNPDTEVLPLIGSKEGIMHISMAFLNNGDGVLVPNPGYPTYSAAAKLAGAHIQHYELSADRGWYPDLDELAGRDLQQTKIMWVNYPHMPTGTKADKGFLADLVAFAKAQHILLINDNPYAFILNEEPLSLLSIPGAKEVVLELNSLSKAHNMAGWRIGMLAGEALYLQTVLRFKSNMDSGMFKPLQLAAVKALELPLSWYQQQNKIYRQRRQLATRLLDTLGCTYDDSQVGMFVWARVPDQFVDGYGLSDQVLYEHDVFITPGGIFGTQGDGYVRVSLCSDLFVFEEAIARVKM